MTMGMIGSLADALQRMGVMTDSHAPLLGPAGTSCDTEIETFCAGDAHELTPPVEGTSHVSGTCSGSGTVCCGNDCYTVELTDCDCDGTFNDQTGACQLSVRLNDTCNAVDAAGEPCDLSDCTVIVRGEPTATWTVDAAAPEVQVSTPGPAAPEVTFDFADAVTNVETIRCELDGMDMDVSSGAVWVEDTPARPVTGGSVTLTARFSGTRGNPGVAYELSDTPVVPAGLYVAIDDSSVQGPVLQVARTLGVAAGQVRHAVFQNGWWTLNGSLPQRAGIEHFELVVGASSLDERQKQRVNQAFALAFDRFVNFKPTATAGSTAAAAGATGATAASGGAGAGAAPGEPGSSPGGVIGLLGTAVGVILGAAAVLISPLRDQLGCNTASQPEQPEQPEAPSVETSDASPAPDEGGELDVEALDRLPDEHP